MARDCHLFLSLAEEGCPLTPKASVVTPEQGEKGLCSAQLTMKPGSCESVSLSERAHSWQKLKRTIVHEILTLGCSLPAR